MEIHLEPWFANLLIVVVTAFSMITTAVILVTRFGVGVAVGEFVEALQRADRRVATPPSIPMSDQERLRRKAVEANNYRIFIGQYSYP